LALGLLGESVQPSGLRRVVFDEVGLTPRLGLRAGTPTMPLPCPTLTSPSGPGAPRRRGAFKAWVGLISPLPASLAWASVYTPRSWPTVSRECRDSVWAPR